MQVFHPQHRQCVFGGQGLQVAAHGRKSLVAPAARVQALHGGAAGEVRAGATRTWEPGTAVVREGGDFFGELMLSGGLRAATVEVTVRAQLTRVPRAAVEQLLAARPGLALHMVHSLVQPVRTLTATVGRLASVDVYGRLVS